MSYDPNPAHHHTFFGKVLADIITGGEDVVNALGTILGFFVNKILPSATSPAALILADLLDSVTKSNLPTEIQQILVSNAPKFIDDAALINSLTKATTGTQLRSNIQQIIDSFGIVTLDQSSKVYLDLMASLDDLINQVASGTPVTFVQAVNIAALAYNCWLQSKGELPKP